LDTAQRLEKVLKEAGISVVMTRRADVYVDLYERANRASRYDDYIFVSLHYNDDSARVARGIETYCLTPRAAGSTMAGGAVTRSDFQKLPGNPNDALNVMLACEVHKQVVKLNSGDSEADRGLKRARFVVLKQNRLPSILVEGGFLSHRAESESVATESYRQRLAEAIGKGLQNYMRLQTTTSVAPAVSPAIKPASPGPSRTTTNAAPVKPESTTNAVPRLTPPVLIAPPTSTNAVAPEVIYPVIPAEKAKPMVAPEPKPEEIPSKHATADQVPEPEKKEPEEPPTPSSQTPPAPEKPVEPETKP
jgi:N-acetylmuramoyl-L-alanine amidase